MSSKHELQKFFGALHRHQEVLIDAFLESENFLTPERADDKVVQDLIRLRLARRTGEVDGIRLSRELISLFERALHDSRRISVDADIGGKLNSIEGLVNIYKIAKASTDRELYMHTIENEIDQLICDIQDSSKDLWLKINNEFGYVSTLDLKMHENERVIAQAKRINSGLGLIRISELSELAGHDRKLKNLLVRWLSTEANKAQKDLTDALFRLNNMLFKFREQQRRTLLVNSFYQKFQSDPGYISNNYAEANELPDLFNRVEPLEIRAYADTNNSQHEELLTDWISGLRKFPVENEKVEIKPVEVTQEQTKVKLQISPLKQLVINFYNDTVNADQELSALDYFIHTPENCDAELWLHAVSSHYNNLNVEERVAFSVNYKEITHSEFNGRFLVRDFCLRFNI